MTKEETKRLIGEAGYLPENLNEALNTDIPIDTTDQGLLPDFESPNKIQDSEYWRKQTGTVMRGKDDFPGYVCFDIETGENERSHIFKPQFKEPRITAKGAPYASDKSIEDQLIEWSDKTSLSATTGMILAIGFNENSKVDILLNREANLQGEKELLAAFWHLYDYWKKERKSIWGFNIKSFDLPFITQRSFIHGLEVPIKEWQPWNLEVNDLKEIWSCGKSWQDGGSISFDNLLKVMGLEPKIDNGKNFASNFLNQTNRHLALAYLEDEMIKQGQLAEMFGAKRKENN